jgi:3-oxoacyl-[acyl-carrier protein] reductase
LAITRRLLAEAWDVVVTSRHRTPELRDLSNAGEGRLAHCAVDFARPEVVRRFAEDPRFLEGFDAFVSNAAIGTEGLLTLTSEAAWRECLEVNLLAPMLLARQVVKGMLNRGGSLVFISSVAARTGLAGLSAYAASKAALVAFSRVLAREYGARGIRSNCILPGYLETDLSASLAAEQKARLLRRTALGRLGDVQDVAGTVMFLLSDDARFITGTEVVIDGGLTA